MVALGTLVERVTITMHPDIARKIRIFCETNDITVSALFRTGALRIINKKEDFIKKEEPYIFEHEKQVVRLIIFDYDTDDEILKKIINYWRRGGKGIAEFSKVINNPKFTKEDLKELLYISNNRIANLESKK